MKKYLLLIVIILLFASCNENDKNNFITSPIDEDYSSIANPKERWEAYNLANYSIEQKWICECFPPNSCNSYIINKSVADVQYELLTDSYYGRTEEEIYNYTKKSSITIDKAFELIDTYKVNAHRIEVEYDVKYGFPTKIFIDIDSLMVDEEISRRFSNLQKIIN